MTYIPSETHKTLYKRISEMVSDGVSFLDIGKALLPKTDPYRAKGIVYRAYKKNKWTKDNEIRVMLGLPKYLFMQHDPTKKPAPVCSSCGEVHAIDRACELQVIVKPKSKPRVKKPKERYPRFRAWMFEEYWKG